MSMSSVGRILGALLAVAGGLLLLISWGIYTSLWTLLGFVLIGMGIFGGNLIGRRQYVRGGTMSAAAAIVAWGLYPVHPLSVIMLSAVALMFAGGILGLILELTAD